nr:MAG TPA: hypothetical protein [Caudoviricetes sp.]
MRIISQDKEFDLPYEKTTIQVFDNGTVAAFSLTKLESDAFITMAKYSTKEKAIKAMEMCRKQYAQCEFNKHFIQKAADNLAEVSITFAGEVRNQLADKYLFQFPADEEVQI